MKILSVLSVLFVLSVSQARDFPGWQGLRVIKSENGASRMTPIRLSEEGGESLLVTKTRQSRLDIYTFNGKKASEIGYEDYENPNYLPMAEDFEKTEIPLDRVPYVAVPHDIDEDGTDEIFLIQSDPRHLILLKSGPEGWGEEQSWELSEEKISSTEPLLINQLNGGTKAFVSYTGGIQVVDVEGTGKVEWLEPREREGDRLRWWFADFDGDGDEDLLEALKTTATPLRWYEAEGDRLHPAVNISDDIKNARVVKIRQTGGKPEVVMLGVGQTGAISYYELGEGEASEFGKRSLLPLSQINHDKWESLELEGKKAVVELGREKPVLNVYELEGAFWRFRKAFPVLQNITKLVARRDESNMILFQVEGENQLYESHWESGRFSFPRSLGEAGADEDKTRLLGFDQYGDQVWWAHQDGKRFALNVWGPDQEEPTQTIFENVSGEFEDCLWLGGTNLLVKKKFSKTLQFCRIEGGTTEFSTSRFKSSELGRLERHGDGFYVLEEGVVQKLGEKLEIVDQIMLDDDKGVASFAFVDEKTAYVLESSGKYMHRLEVDESGIFQSVERTKVPYAFEMFKDPVLGFALASGSSINIPSEGSSALLSLAARIDPNKDAIREYEKRAVNNIFVVDVDGDGVDEIASVDYGRHEISVYGDGESGIEEVISWKVFDDGKYPYGQDGRKQNNTNPYRILGFDLDGDKAQDLVLACHDRILIYLAKEIDG